MRRNGFTLLEVMIALLVFSLGLLGMAGLLAVSVRTNHGAYLRTQATFLAQSMADRMRANKSAFGNSPITTLTIRLPPAPPAPLAWVRPPVDGQPWRRATS